MVSLAGNEIDGAKARVAWCLITPCRYALKGAPQSCLRRSLAMSNIKIELSMEKLQVVMDVLTNLPWGSANPVIVDIDNQVKQQLNIQPKCDTTDQLEG